MNILEEIAKKRRVDVENRKKNISVDEIKKMAMAKENAFSFEKAISKVGMNFICEVKKASPSKGIIAEDFPYLEIAKEYEQAGAAAISVLTEPEYFMGRDQYLQEIAKNVRIPVLRKDFVVDEYQIYEAKVLGACAVLLICSLLRDEELVRFLKISHEIGLSALVEAHDEVEVKRAIDAGARIIGVNNRDLKTFTVDINNSVRLRGLVPENIIFVSESGISTPEDVQKLRENGTNAVLVGETLMRNSDKKKALRKLAGEEL